MKDQTRRGVPDDFPSVVALWRRSVLVTHHFVTLAQIDAMEPLVSAALDGVDLWLNTDEDGRVRGFMGLSGPEVEMLFVDPDFCRRGLGTRLLDLARKLYGRLSLDVNEQNPEALAFYRRFGFEVVGRSPLDKRGQPFPLLRLRLPEDGPPDGKPE
ncbi:MAG: GNAT family N-acetyltransferase [Deltaproteobacteria bacterium]|jgi:putative acetyltransferase|nr:GNAT family N-acetyltransferase [Deltaproteobacteria bacterium]